MTPNEPRLTRDQQREATREKARQLREQHKRQETNKKVWIRVAVVVGLLAVIGGVTLSIVQGASNKNKAGSAPANLIYNDGIKIGKGLEAFTTTNTPAPNPTSSVSADGSVPNIIMYVDYQCPVCQAFEMSNAEQIRKWVESGAATVEIHPISFLDGRASPNTYSSRAANAALCVANYSPNNYFKFSSLLFENQPAENTAGPENPELIQRIKDAGVVTTPDLTNCVNNKTFGKWLTDTTKTALTEKVPGTDLTVDGTPFVVVNGQKYSWTTGEELTSPARFAQFVQMAAKL